MPTNKNAAIRYQTLDKCFRDRRHRYYIDDLIDACEEALEYYNGNGGVSRRQIFEDIKFLLPSKEKRDEALKAIRVAQKLYKQKKR